MRCSNLEDPAHERLVDVHGQNCLGAALVPAPAVTWRWARPLSVPVFGWSRVRVEWAFFAIGSGCLLVGSVAQDVAWGMDIYRERHPEKPVGRSDA